MSLDKQAIILSKTGFLAFPRKETDAPTDEIYDKGFIVVADKIRWDRATKGLAKECLENATRSNIDGILHIAKRKAENGLFSYYGELPSFCTNFFMEDLRQHLEKDGFHVILYEEKQIKVDWSSANFGTALVYREIARKVKTCTIM